APRCRARRARGAVRARRIAPGVRRRLRALRASAIARALGRQGAVGPWRDRCSAPREGEIANLVPEPLAAALEAGRWPLGRAGDEGAVGGDIREAGRGGQYLQHLRGVGLPVGGEPQQAGPGEAAREKLGARALTVTTLEVARSHT